MDTDVLNVRQNSVTICLYDSNNVLIRAHSGRNVFTETGKTWLRDLSYWQTMGTTDVPVSAVRPRWIIAGTSSQPSVSSVSTLATAQTFDGTNFLKQLSPPTFSPVNVARYQVSYPAAEFASVNLTEFGLVVDDGSIVATSSSVNVIAYRTLSTPIVKTTGQTLTVNWSLML